ncbi:MAG: radical SAM protein [Phycisphaerae bacterium]|jgi:wyosine [tRNA(Phe)-imidazoG37] synthetase (radical SAM superfamily)
MSETQGQDHHNVIRDHRRQWHDFLYVYPVVARRSKGLSVGINLNPDKRCTYSCVYCQVDRKIARNLHSVDLEVLRRELRAVLHEAAEGTIWQHPRFSAVPLPLRRINDIAFSGDGEPTCMANFDQAVAAAAEVKRQLDLADVKLVVITNATAFDGEPFRRALPILEANNGEIWAKLDAGTEAYFLRINRPGPGLTLDKVVSNITEVAKGCPLVIQTLFLSLAGDPPPLREVTAYCERLKGILRAGGQIKLVQIHTVARTPADARAGSLDDAALEALAAVVRQAIPAVPVEVFHG